MGDADDRDDFERRLAGQPLEPTADTRELEIAAREGERTNASLTLGELSVVDGATVNQPRAGSAGLVPWVLVGVLCLLLLVIVFAFLNPARDRADEASVKIEGAHAAMAELRQRIDELEQARAELQAANTALTTESERTAGALDAMHRSEEERAALEKRKPKPLPTPKSSKKRKRSRRH
ncbi:MAG: hypothetical protein V3T05_13115 [Myxococcota bacterium]